MIRRNTRLDPVRGLKLRSRAARIAAHQDVSQFP